MNEHDLPGAQQPLADGQGADLVIGDDTARVADDMRFAFVQPEHAVDVQPGVHAGDDGDVARRRQRQRAGEGLRVAGVIGQVLISD